MASLKLKIKKTLLKRKVDGVSLSGYYGRVITNGTKTFEEILRQSTHGSTLDYREAKLAGEMMLDGIAEAIKQGYIVDLGPIGKLYPAVNGTWKENADDLSLSELTPKVNYKPSDDVAGAVRAATLAWTDEEETSENTTPADDSATTTGNGDSGSSTGTTTNPTTNDDGEMEG